jgi:hypothetical protein
MNLYNIYQALKARKGIYLVRKWLKVNITFGESLEQMKGRWLESYHPTPLKEAT